MAKNAPIEVTPNIALPSTSRSSPISTRSKNSVRVTLAHKSRRTWRYGLSPPVPTSGSKRSACCGPHDTQSSTLVRKCSTRPSAPFSILSSTARNGASSTVMPHFSTHHPLPPLCQQNQSRLCIRPHKKQTIPHRTHKDETKHHLHSAIYYLE